MQFNITQAQFGTRPPVVKPDPKVLEFLEKMGWEKLISDHYDLPKESNIKDFFLQPRRIWTSQRKTQQIFIPICRTRLLQSK